MKTLYAIAISFAMVAAHSLIALVLESNDGQRIEAEVVALQDDAVEIKKVDDGQLYRIPLTELTPASNDAIRTELESKFTAELRDQGALAVLTLTHANGKALDNVRLLEVGDDSFTYEILAHSVRREATPGELKLNQYNGMQAKPVEGELLLVEKGKHRGEIIRIVDLSGLRIVYDVEIPTSGPHTSAINDLSLQSQVLLEAWKELYMSSNGEVRAGDGDAIKFRPMEAPTLSDPDFDQWVIQWYEDNLFSYPLFPAEIRQKLMDNPRLRIEYLDTVSFPEEVERFPQLTTWKIGAIARSKPLPDDPWQAARIITELYHLSPERAMEHLNLVLALSLIYDGKQDFRTACMFSSCGMMEERFSDWLTPHEVLFLWRTDPVNIEHFHFKPGELSILENAWANKSSQRKESLDWALRRGLQQPLDDMYSQVEYQRFGLGDNRPIQNIDHGVCYTQAYVLEEKLMALNIPAAFFSGECNSEIMSAGHAYNYALMGWDEQGEPIIESAGRWRLDSGRTHNPTDNCEIPDGFFIQRMGLRYNEDISRKLRLKTLFANTLEGNARTDVLKDILLDDVNFGEAQAWLILEGLLPRAYPGEHSLDNSAMFQILTLQYLKQGDTERAIESFQAMLESEPDEHIRLGWGIQTLVQMPPQQRLQFGPYMAPYVPSYPASFYAYTYLKARDEVTENEVRDSLQQVRRFSANNEFNQMIQDRRQRKR